MLSLSVHDGRLDVPWQVASGPADVVHLEWVERNGPAVEPPEQEGFGSKLIHRALMLQTDATVSAEFQSEGLKVVIDLPLRASAGMVAPLRSSI